MIAKRIFFFCSIWTYNPSNTRSEINAKLTAAPHVSGVIYKCLNKDTRNLVAHYGRPRAAALFRGRRGPARLSEGFLVRDPDDRADRSPRAGMSQIALDTGHGNVSWMYFCLVEILTGGFFTSGAPDSRRYARVTIISSKTNGKSLFGMELILSTG